MKRSQKEPKVNGEILSLKIMFEKKPQNSPVNKSPYKCPVSEDIQREMGWPVCSFQAAGGEIMI